MLPSLSSTSEQAVCPSFPVRSGKWQTSGFGIALAGLLLAVFATLAHAAPGDLDLSFGSGFGKVLLPRAGSDGATAVAVQPDRKILISGNCRASSGANPPWEFCVVRLSESGAPDPTFGVNGVATVEVPGSSVFPTTNGIALLGSGKIVLGGSCFDSALQRDQLCLTRLHSDGTLDTTYGTNGLAKIGWGTQFIFARSLATQVDDQVVIGATCEPPAASQWSLCALRVTPNGQLDTTFGVAGGASALILDHNEAGGIAIQPDGKIVLSGRCESAVALSPYLFCAVRLLANGQTDPSFGVNGSGIVSYVVGSNTGDSANSALLIQRDGKIVLGGRCRTSASASLSFCLLRLHVNGTVDNSYGATGLLIAIDTNIEAEVNSMALQPDGKIVLGGTCTVTTDPTLRDFCLARIHEDGALDKSFSGDGKVVTPIGSGKDGISALALQPDGKVIAVGNCDTGADSDYCIARYDGGPATGQQCSFDIDGDGKVLATVDGLIAARISLGITGSAVIGGVVFPPTATRSSWAAIRAFLNVQCGFRLQ